MRWPWLVAAVAVAATVVVVYQGPEWVRGAAERTLTVRLERQVHIDGAIRLEPWSLTPTLRAGEVRIANPPWSSVPDLLWVREVTVSLDLRRFLRGNWHLPEVRLVAPRLHLQEAPDGEPNWRFPVGQAEGGAGLTIGSLVVDDAQITVDLPSQGAALAVTLDARSPRWDAVGLPVVFMARGQWRGESLAVEGQAGNLLALAEGAEAYPLRAKGQIGRTRFGLDGQVADLAALAGLDVRFTLSGSNLADLYRLGGVPLPATPPYRVAARLTHQGGLWSFEGLTGRVGRSDVAGDLSVDRRVVPQEIHGRLVSRQVDLADLSGFIGARTESGQVARPAGGRVLPDQPFDLGKIAAANVDVRYQGDRIQTARGFFQSLQAHLRIDQGRVRLDPLSLGMARGTLRGSVDLDARQPPLKAALAVDADRMRLKDLIPLEDSRRLTSGLLAGRARLAMVGNSVAQLLGSADGELAFAMSGGATDRLVVRLANLDLANGLVAWLSGGPQEAIHCLVGDFRAATGVFTARQLVLDSEKTRVRGSGVVNLRDERLDLHLAAESKDVSLLSLRGPLRLTGSLAQPRVTPDPAPLAGRLATAAALGFVAPPLALLPLVDLGGEDAAGGCGPAPAK